MAAILQSIEYTHLCMRPIWYLKRRWNHVTHGLHHKILALQWWLVRENLSQGILFSLPTITHHYDYHRCEHGRLGQTLPTPTVDHSALQWPLVNIRTPTPCQHVELREVCLTLLYLEQEIFGQTVLIESDNTASVSYINKQGGVVSKKLNNEICTLYEWAILRSLKLRAIHRPGVNNKLGDYLS